MGCTHRIDENTCDREKYRDLNKCVLHCYEGEVEVREDYEQYVKDFHESLSDYIDERVSRGLKGILIEDNMYLSDYDVTVHEDYDTYTRFIVGVEGTQIHYQLAEKLEKINLIISDISFPKGSTLKGLTTETQEILSRLGKVNFISCDFNCKYITESSTNSYYLSCVFRENVVISPFIGSDNDYIYRFVFCDFCSGVIVRSSIFISRDDSSKDMNSNLFYECTFQSYIKLKNINFNQNVFRFPETSLNYADISLIKSYSEFKKRFIINELLIDGCSFKKSFKLNSFSQEFIEQLEKYGYEFEIQDITTSSIQILNSKFKSKFELKDRYIKELAFVNTNAEGIFDLFNSRIIKGRFEKCIFYDFAGFEEVKFGIDEKKLNNIISNSKDKEDVIRRSYLTLFKYATFLDFSSFRGASFLSGLDFSKTNLKDKPNFLNASINILRTNRETFRIIKSSFDDIGNYIEGNKFFADEMRAYSRELWNTEGKITEKVVFFTNYLVSSFGSSYIRPISLLICFSFVYSILYKFFSMFFTTSMPDPDSVWVRDIYEVLNYSAKNIIPFSQFTQGKEGFEFISLIFYIIFGILIWQTIVAVKRHTKR